MHPLAHMLTGAMIGQAASTPAGAFVGGFLSHFILDAIPHTERKTFRPERRTGRELDLLEAGAEVIVGTLLLTWAFRACYGVRPLSMGTGALAALLPDLIDLPLMILFRFNVVHITWLHWTVKRRHAVWGILTQLAVIGAAVTYLWRATQCG